MAKKLIGRLFPNMHLVREHRALSVLQRWLHKEDLWHINRHSIAAGFAVGVFCAFIPLPFQMIIAALLAIPAGANIPVSVVLVWISNPITMGPIFFLCYKVGNVILQTNGAGFRFEMSIDWWLQLGQLWAPLLLGCLIIGSSAAAISYVIVKIVWRIHIISYLKQRKFKLSKSKQISDQ